MARSPFPHRVVLVLLLTAILAAPAAVGAQPRPHAEKRPTDFVVALVSELRVQVWSLLSDFWEKNGCVADPHGVCVSGSGGTTSAPIQADEGCGLDPHGGCGH